MWRVSPRVRAARYGAVTIRYGTVLRNRIEAEMSVELPKPVNLNRLNP